MGAHLSPLPPPSRVTSRTRSSRARLAATSIHIDVSWHLTLTRVKNTNGTKQLLTSARWPASGVTGPPSFHPVSTPLNPIRSDHVDASRPSSTIVIDSIDSVPPLAVPYSAFKNLAYPLPHLGPQKLQLLPKYLESSQQRNHSARDLANDRICYNSRHFHLESCALDKRRKETRYPLRYKPLVPQNSPSRILKLYHRRCPADSSLPLNFVSFALQLPKGARPGRGGREEAQGWIVAREPTGGPRLDSN